MAKIETEKIVVPGRLSYAFVNNPDATGVYRTALLIPKTDTATVAKLKEVQDKILAKAAAANGGSLPVGFKRWIKDGDKVKEEGDPINPITAGHWIVNGKTAQKAKPSLFVMSGGKPVEAPAEAIYSGCYAHVSFAARAYEWEGQKGISAFLNAICKTKDGEPFGSTGGDNGSDFEGIADTSTALPFEL